MSRPTIIAVFIGLGILSAVICLAVAGAGLLTEHDAGFVHGAVVVWFAQWLIRRWDERAAA